MGPSPLHQVLLDWFSEHGRDLPWREPDVSPWGVLVSEIMLQQTPVGRVLPRWVEWMDSWPTPADLAAAPSAAVLRAWDRLGYPRRALRLQQAAGAIVGEHDGVVPTSEAELRSLPGVGEYTAAAVAAFAHRRRAVVLDTNVRRVLERLVGAGALPAPTLTNAERRRAADLLPAEADRSARWNAALMELGALVCTARTPRCGDCPVRDRCGWLAAGRPQDTHAHRRRRQAWAGTDRQVRGRIMAALRASEGAVPVHHLVPLWPEATQFERALAGLVRDGLAEQGPGGYHLPGASGPGVSRPMTPAATEPLGARAPAMVPDAAADRASGNGRTGSAGPNG
ncbi:A/G-specific adenine glycosylase [Pseudactinotalea sp. Z1739]|uniref:A/G-specific adenine glycosylase n=1 Tax=Pseudactinotalea sp. Z1739 TaxID=3413028 RepID=UPI003C7992DD